MILTVFVFHTFSLNLTFNWRLPFLRSKFTIVFKLTVTSNVLIMMRRPSGKTVIKNLFRFITDYKYSFDIG